MCQVICTHIDLGNHTHTTIITCTYFDLENYKIIPTLLPAPPLLSHLLNLRLPGLLFLIEIMRDVWEARLTVVRDGSPFPLPHHPYVAQPC
jgi:hypothetical protein